MPPIRPYPGCNNAWLRIWTSRLPWKPPGLELRSGLPWPTASYWLQPANIQQHSGPKTRTSKAFQASTTFQCGPTRLPCRPARSTFPAPPVDRSRSSIAARLRAALTMFAMIAAPHFKPALPQPARASPARCHRSPHRMALSPEALTQENGQCRLLR
jgi:hypothetical protein